MSLGTLPPDYQSLSAVTKQDLLWSEVNKNVYPDDRLPTTGPNIFNSLIQLWPSKLTWAFTHVSDERSPENPARVLHPHGSVAKATLEIFSNPNSAYTGIFRSGATHPAIVRASIASVDATNFMPGVSLKILLDGKPSVNMFALNSLDGQGANKNFFEKTLSTVLPDSSSVKLQFVTSVFSHALKTLPGGPNGRPEGPNVIPLYELAQVDEPAGTSIVAPYAIQFIPNKSNGWSPDDNTDFRRKLQDFSQGTVLWTIAAQPRPGTGEQSEVIGRLLLASPFVASYYGDEGLFFQHPRHRS
jgi:hypothetical protein